MTTIYAIEEIKKDVEEFTSFVIEDKISKSKILIKVIANLFPHHNFYNLRVPHQDNKRLENNTWSYHNI
jgi:hypothetical protein